jgi:hypothetical protein
VAKLYDWQTTLKLDAGTAEVLTDNGVSVKPTGDAHPYGGAIAFPITGGSLDLSSLAGTIEHSGGLQFSAGKTTLGVQDFVIDTAKGVLTAKVSGTSTRVPLLDLNLSGASIKPDSKGRHRHQRQGDADRGGRRGAEQDVRRLAVHEGDPGGHGEGRRLLPLVRR